MPRHGVAARGVRGSGSAPGLRMLWLLPACLALGLAQDTPPYPTPPVQTALQKAVFDRRQAEAKVLSDKASPELLEFFASPGFAAVLRACCPEAAALPPKELLERFREEVRTAELAHAFPSTNDAQVATPGSHFQIKLGMEYKFFLNSYQAALATNESAAAVARNAAGLGRLALPAWGFPGAAEPRHPSQQVNIADFAETEIFGCPSFEDPKNPTWEESAHRMVYVAHNFRQVSTGSSPTFGDVAAIFSPSYVKDMVLIAPVDTGLWEMSCNKSVESPRKLPFNMTCESWRPTTVGTLDHMDHILLQNLGTWREATDAARDTIYWEAARMFERSAFAGDYTALPDIPLLSLMKYWETNILGNPRLPEGVSFLIGNFRALFGTAAGRTLQEFADSFGWPLVWADGVDPKTEKEKHWSNISFPLRGRVLDPTAAGIDGLNVTLAEDSKGEFWSLWNEISFKREEAGKDEKQWSLWWNSLAQKQVQLAPVTHARCGSVDDCVGRNVRSGSCVCKVPKLFVV